MKRPVHSAISKRVYRHLSQTCCPWNVKFSQEPAEDSPFRAREFFAWKDSVTLARDTLALDQEAFRKSPMKRVKRVKRVKPAGLRRNATAVRDDAST